MGRPGMALFGPVVRPRSEGARKLSPARVEWREDKGGWDGSRPERAVGIQPGFTPNPDTGWKPMLHCSSECQAVTENAS
jgi:hypothetical protein